MVMKMAGTRAMMYGFFFKQRKTAIVHRVTVASTWLLQAKYRQMKSKPDGSANEKINKPAPGYDVQRVVEALKQFEGDFVLQWCLLRSPDFDSTSDDVVLPMLDIVRVLHPREVMAYTIDRPTPAQNLAKVTPDEMRILLKPLIDEGFQVQIKG